MVDQSSYPRLSGGAFFSLLLEARKKSQKSINRKTKVDIDDTHRELNLFARLIMISVSRTEDLKDWIKEDSFKETVSKYKNCKIPKSMYLPFTEDKENKAFDNRIKSKDEYQLILKDMQDLIDDFIDTNDSEDKAVWLVKKLLELIESDVSIKDEDELFIYHDGKSVSKSELIRDMHNERLPSLSICLSAFLLGVWHFAVVSRQDNPKGNESDIKGLSVKCKIEFININKTDDDVSRDAAMYGNSHENSEFPLKKDAFVLSSAKEEYKLESDYEGDFEILYEVFKKTHTDRYIAYHLNCDPVQLDADFFSDIELFEKTISTSIESLHTHTSDKRVQLISKFVNTLGGYRLFVKYCIRETPLTYEDRYPIKNKRGQYRMEKCNLIPFYVPKFDDENEKSEYIERTVRYRKSLLLIYNEICGNNT